MSLARLAMRIAAARALRGATLAEERVHDSAIAPIDQTIAEERQPILIVTTDDHEMEVTGRDLFHGDVSCDLVIEAAIAARVEVAGEESVITIPHTDEGMELALDLMEHQVMAALTRERSDWSHVWMKLVPRISRRLSRRGASVEKGVRFAARQIVLTCDLIEAPTDGATIAAGTAWADLLFVMGTALAVAPFSHLVRMAPKGCLKVLMNMNNTKETGGYDFEGDLDKLFLQGKCDELVAQLCHEVGWTEDFEKVLPPYHAGKHLPSKL